MKKRGQGERVAEERWKGKQGLERDGWRWTDSEERRVFNMSTVAWQHVWESNYWSTPGLLIPLPGKNTPLQNHCLNDYSCSSQQEIKMDCIYFL